MATASPRAESRSIPSRPRRYRSEEHTSELQSLTNLVCRLLLEKKKKMHIKPNADVAHELREAALELVKPLHAPERLRRDGSATDGRSLRHSRGRPGGSVGHGTA